MSAIAKRVTHCLNPDCGHKLALSNTTGRCYRECIKPSFARAPLRDKAVPVEKIIMAAESHFGMLISEIFGSNKDDRLVKMRKAIVYLLMTDGQLREIAVGRVVRRERSTVEGMFNSATTKMPDLEADIAAIRAIYKAVTPM